MNIAKRIGIFILCGLMAIVLLGSGAAAAAWHYLPHEGYVTFTIPFGTDVKPVNLADTLPHELQQHPLPLKLPTLAAPKLEAMPPLPARKPCIGECK